MAYNALVESLALIESRQLVRVHRLSRRRRLVAMSVDVAGDLAVTSFLRRGVSCTWEDTHALARREGQWVLLGGSGGSGNDHEDLLADRPQTLMDWLNTLHPPGWHVLPGRSLLVSGSGGGVLDSGGALDQRPGSGRWVNHTSLRASAAVESLNVGGRVLPVPWRGRVSVVWTGPSGQRAVAYDREGRPIDEVVLIR